MKVKADLVSLFQVPLQCPAAPEIACGGRARPILLALESDATISEAWVNRAGNMLAVVGLAWIFTPGNPITPAGLDADEA